MLLKNCHIEMNINFYLERAKAAFFLDSISQNRGNFLQEDILQYKDNIDDLTEKLFFLENVDF